MPRLAKRRPVLPARRIAVRESTDAELALDRLLDVLDQRPTEEDAKWTLDVEYKDAEEGPDMDSVLLRLLSEWADEVDAARRTYDLAAALDEIGKNVIRH
jgi:hypothetical protein